jgi:hypothetical protein
MSLRGLTEDSLSHMGDRQFRDVLMTMLNAQQRDRRENQLLYYMPASEKAMQVHLSEAKICGVGGGNGSGKTDTALVEMSMLATGTIPDYLAEIPSVRKRQRGPIKARVICESLTTVLHPIILPKLKWWEWSGISFPGGDKGHFGWIPRDCLIGGSWDKSWSEKLRMLRVYYRNPDNPEEIQGESTIQFMSKDQDPTDFASGDFHFVLFDEPATYAIWRENEARTMRVNGRMMLAMTWPDDPAIPVDWLFTEIYDKAQPGPNKSKQHDWINIWTTDNKNLDQNAVAAQSASWSDAIRDVRIYGKPIRFSHRVHPLFTPNSDWWCFPCGRTVSPIDGACSCGAKDIMAFTHVGPFETRSTWPTVWVLDPHPRKPHMFAWIQVSPDDDWWVVREGEVDGDPTQVREYVDRVESGMGLGIARRLIDPNMGRSPASSSRGITWQDEFDRVGLVTDLAEDSEVGRSRINEMLRPDAMTRRPRLMVHTLCEKMISQMTRYVWDDYKQALEKAQKQKPKEKHDDFPTILRYFANAEPKFRDLREGTRIVRRNDPRVKAASRSHRPPVVRSPSYAGRFS